MDERNARWSMDRSRGAAAFLFLMMVAAAPGAAQQMRTYTRADTLRGDFESPARAWWDVEFYDLNVAINPAGSTIRGYNAITYRVLEPATRMQIDLQVP